MNLRTAVAISLLLGIGGCLIPSYQTDSGTATGGTSPGGSAAEAGKQSAAGSKTGGTASMAGDGNSGSGGSSGGSSDAGTGGTGPDPGCGPEKKLCAGECVDVSDATFGCTATSCNQSECPAGGRTYECASGACVIASCVAGKKVCDGKCVAVDDPTYGCSPDGCDPAACPNPGTGTLVCEGSACVVGQCDSSKKKCGSNCVPKDANYGCDDASTCDACESNEVCSGSPSECTCIADDVEACKGKACGPAYNNCGDIVTCPDTCVSPESCNGGVEGANECGCTPNNACLGKECGSVEDSCGDTQTCQNTCNGATPACAGNTCVECTAPADCPAIVCAKAACTNNKCTYGTVAANTACVAGTCSTTKAGICIRPQVTVGTFKVDATEVTRGAYLAFVQAKNGNTTGQAAVCSGNTSYVPTADWPPALKDYEMPAVYVDWCDAHAYCAWAGGRLCGKIGGGATPHDDYNVPAQSQWMRACSGTTNTAYPYGNAYIEDRCNDGQPLAVATFPQCVGGYPGLYDMSGNAPEWEDSCSGIYCRKRGAHYGQPDSKETDLRCDDNGNQPRDHKDANISFRCCSSP